MTEQNKQLLEQLSKTQYGMALKEFLNEELQIIGNIESVVDWEETQGRRWGVKFIKKLFSFMEQRGIKEKGKNLYE